MSSIFSVGSYPCSIISFAAFINLLSSDFSFTILIYFSTLAVVGTFSGNPTIYSKPPILSNIPIDVNSAFSVIISIGSDLLYKFSIASYIVLLSSL